MPEQDNTQQDDSAPEFDLDATLAAAEKAGVTLMTQDAFDKRFGREAKKRDEMAERLKEIEAQNAELATALQQYEDKGKTEEQRRLEDLAKLEKRAKSYADELEVERQHRADLERKIYENNLQSALGEVLAPKAANLPRAIRNTLAEMPGLGLTDDGQLLYTDPKTERDYVGDEARAKLDAWWEDQHDMHRNPGRAGGPPITNPKPNGDPGRSPADMTPEERFQRRHAGV